MSYQIHADASLSVEMNRNGSPETVVAYLDKNGWPGRADGEAPYFERVYSKGEAVRITIPGEYHQEAQRTRALCGALLQGGFFSFSVSHSE